MTIPSLVMDIAAVGVVVLCALYYAHRGFVAGLLGFLGTLGALLLAFFGARALAPWVFDTFFEPGLTGGVTAAIESHGVGNVDVQALVDGALGFLPEGMRAAVLQNLPQAPVISAGVVAKEVVQQVVAPILLPFIHVVLFFVIFALARLLLGLVRRLAAGVARLPVISTINGALGAAMGVLVSVLYIYLLLCLIWGYDVFNPQNAVGEAYFSKSLVWGLFVPFRLFV